MSYLVALSGLAASTAERAVARDMSGLTALVAGLVLLERLGTVTAYDFISFLTLAVTYGKLTQMALAYCSS